MKFRSKNMTALQASNQLLSNAEGDVIIDRDIEAIGVAVRALEKQIPKSPIEQLYPWAICPMCGGSVNMQNVCEHIENGENTYCEHCGQELAWEEQL